MNEWLGAGMMDTIPNGIESKLKHVSADHHRVFDDDVTE